MGICSLRISLSLTNLQCTFNSRTYPNHVTKSINSQWNLFSQMLNRRVNQYVNLNCGTHETKIQFHAKPCKPS